MKIAIPVAEKNGENSKVFNHFGSAPYYALYDGNSNQLRFMENGQKEQNHGHCRPAMEIFYQRVNAVATPGMGVRAVEKMKELGIKLYHCKDQESISVVIKQWMECDLKDFTTANICGNSQNCQKQHSTH